eukprot:scaffold188_cov107-Isochrysis_galbana.AAC.8
MSRLQPVPLFLPLLFGAGVPLPRGVLFKRVRRAIVPRLGRDQPAGHRVLLPVGLAVAEARGPPLRRLVPHHLGALLLDDPLLRCKLLPPRERLGLGQRLLARQRGRGLRELDGAFIGLRGQYAIQPIRQQLRVIPRYPEQVSARVFLKRCLVERARIRGAQVTEVVREIVLLVHLSGRTAAARCALRQQRAHVQRWTRRSGCVRHAGRRRVCRCYFGQRWAAVNRESRVLL